MYHFINQCLLQVVSLFLQLRKKTKPTYFAFKIHPDCHSVWNPNFKFYSVLIHFLQFMKLSQNNVTFVYHNTFLVN